MTRFTNKPIASTDDLKACVPLFLNTENKNTWQDPWNEEKALGKLIYYYNFPKFKGWMIYAEGKLVGVLVGNVSPAMVSDLYVMRGLYFAGSETEEVTTEMIKTMYAGISASSIFMSRLDTGITQLPIEYWLAQGFKYLPEIIGRQMVGFAK